MTNSATTPTDELTGWFLGRIPDDWFTAAPRISGDREEVLVIGTLPEATLDEGASEQTRGAARASRIDRFRSETKRKRIAIAEEGERLFGRKVSWGAECGGEQQLFTTLGVPVMTRLRLPERHVLDTLIDAGVARSRSEALAWCVRLVGTNEEDWISGLREALQGVEKVRAQGPDRAAPSERS
ncbi:MAG: hypothetical protein ABR541_09450 [Candidatus Dormibacteria bacterium]